jgi:cytochrome c556
MKLILPKILLACFALNVASVAWAAPKPEDEIKYRQSVFNVIGRNFGGVLNGIAKGDVPYDQATAVKTAQLIEVLHTLPYNSFGPGTDQGAPTKADPKIWQEPAKFKTAAENTQRELAKLPEAAKSLDTLKAQVGAVGKTCKACHDDFRVKQK